MVAGVHGKLYGHGLGGNRGGQRGFLTLGHLGCHSEQLRVRRPAVGNRGVRIKWM